MSSTPDTATIRRRQRSRPPESAFKSSGQGRESFCFFCQRLLISRPPGRAYKTILSVDGGGLRAIFAATILIEVEQSIKRHLIQQPHLMHPFGHHIRSVDDFDINLADYFDCMTGISAGGWTTLYLASRGGQGAVRAVLEKPDIVAKYGVIPAGGAAALRIFHIEFGSIIYPTDQINFTAGTPLDVTNPNAPGVLTPLYPSDGLESTLEAFLGNTTLEDCDTSIIIPTYDLIRSVGVYFVQNKFREPSVTSAARLKPRFGPRPLPVNNERFTPDFMFEEGKNYYLRDVGVATGSVPAFNAAKNVSQVGNDSVEFILIDGINPLASTGLPASSFVAAETGAADIESSALLSIGNGRATSNLVGLANEGAIRWFGEDAWLGLTIGSGTEGLSALTDYVYYSNPNVKPNQYLRVQRFAPVTSEEGVAFSGFTDATRVTFIEEIAKGVAQEYRESIDSYVRQFVFG